MVLLRHHPAWFVECKEQQLVSGGREERPPFHILPRACRARLFGVDYALVPQADGGELYVTRQAWHWLDYLNPERWWDSENLVVRGERLEGSTGTVYRASSQVPGMPSRDLVIKYSRIAQDVPLFIPNDFLETLPRDAVATARFLGPFAEFGLIHELRNSILNSGRRRLRTKFPLAIYSPPERYPLWQTGRKSDIFRAHSRAVARAQFENGLGEIALDIERDYLEIFAWVNGIDAEEAFHRGMIGKEELFSLTRAANKSLFRLSFCVLDNKPRHLIVRPLPDGSLLQRHGTTVYTMVDFELLQRNEDGPTLRLFGKRPDGA